MKQFYLPTPPGKETMSPMDNPEFDLEQDDSAVGRKFRVRPPNY